MTAQSKKILVFRIFAGSGLVIAVAWLVTFMIPATREMMLDYLFSFLLMFWLIGLLFWTANQSANLVRRFWTLLAIAWVLNLFGNIAWTASDMMSDQEVAIFGWIDLFYLARYSLIFATFWYHPPREPDGRLRLIIVASTATAITWAGLFRPALAWTSDPFLYFVGGALYPILDVLLFFLALLSWRYTVAARLRETVGLLVIAMVVYGAANWINFVARVITLEAASSLAAFFWPWADICTGLAALYILKADEPLTFVYNEADFSLTKIGPYFAGLLTIGLTIGDVIIRGQIDNMLLICAAIVLLSFGLHFAREKRG